MSEINLLIIEDEPAQVQMYHDVIEQHNKTSKHIIIPTLKQNYDDGVTALKSPNFDAAIIDLKLSASNELEGKKLVEAANQKIRIPIIVYSGSLGQIDDIPENTLLRKKIRDQVLVKDILVEIEEIFETGITRFLRNDGLIDKMLTEIFWRHLSDSLYDLKDSDTEKALVRYISSHIQEFLEMDGEGDLENLHPAEFYIFPPIKKHLSTGDIIKNRQDNSCFLLLTPACDILLRKDKNNSEIKARNADKALLVNMTPWNSIENFNSVTQLTGVNNETRKKLQNYYLKNKKERYHFLPPYKSIKGFFADFQSQTSIDFSLVENEANYERVATVSQPFLKDIIARFSQYYSRQGQPDLLQEKTYNLLVDQNH